MRDPFYQVRVERASIDGFMERVSSLHTALSGFAIALVAAAIGDPLVESISNAGIFGSGYRDDNHQSVFTVLVVGLVLACLLVVARFRRARGVSGRSAREWLRVAASGFAKTSASRNIAAVFAAQLAVVYAMESCEQALAHGGPLHGLLWLGAPALFSLAIHFGVCLFCSFAARRITRCLLAAAIVALCDALDRLLVALARDAVRGFAERSGAQIVCRLELFVAHCIRGRAPPSCPAFA